MIETQLMLSWTTFLSPRTFKTNWCLKSRWIFIRPDCVCVCVCVCTCTYTYTYALARAPHQPRPAHLPFYKSRAHRLLPSVIIIDRTRSGIDDTTRCDSIKTRRVNLWRLARLSAQNPSVKDVRSRTGCCRRHCRRCRRRCNHV